MSSGDTARTIGRMMFALDVELNLRYSMALDDINTIPDAPVIMAEEPAPACLYTYLCTNVATVMRVLCLKTDLRTVHTYPKEKEHPTVCPKCGGNVRAIGF